MLLEFIMFNYIDKLHKIAIERLSEGVENMSIPQWGIVAGIALVMGFVLLKSKQ